MVGTPCSYREGCLKVEIQIPPTKMIGVLSGDWKPWLTKCGCCRAVAGGDVCARCWFRPSCVWQVGSCQQTRGEVRVARAGWNTLFVRNVVLDNRDTNPSAFQFQVVDSMGLE